MAVGAFDQLPPRRPSAAGVAAIRAGEAFRVVAPSHRLEVLLAGVLVAEALKELGDGHNLGDGDFVRIVVRLGFSPGKRNS